MYRSRNPKVGTFFRSAAPNQSVAELFKYCLVEDLFALADFYSVSVDYILGRTDKRNDK